MIRAIALSIFGACVCFTTVAQAQGDLMFNNYAEPYVPITYNYTTAPPAPPIGEVVGINDGIQMEVWWAPGEADYNDLIFQGAVAAWSAYDGFTAPSQIFRIPEYESGETWTLQLRGFYPSGALATVGPLVQTSDIGDQSVSPPEVPTFVYAWYVPEPTVFTLLSLGSLALVMGRRRKSGDWLTNRWRRTRTPAGQRTDTVV